MPSSWPCMSPPRAGPVHSTPKRATRSSCEINTTGCGGMVETKAPATAKRRTGAEAPPTSAGAFARHLGRLLAFQANLLALLR